MFEKQTCNMKNREAYIRMFIASLILIYGVIESSLLFGLLSIVIFYTAVSRFCFMYYLFHINEKYSVQNYYLSLLPKYRTSPVFIFNEEGKIVYENKAAQENLSNINSITSLNIENYRGLIQNNAQDILLYEYEGKNYQIELKGIAKEKFILAYFTDVTELMELNEAIEETQREVIYAMGEIGETRSKETGNHVKRVALYSRELALLYGLCEEEASKLQMASPMHDIGKVGIPDAILNAPRKLSVEEFVIMQTHAALGYNMLKNSNKPILQAAAIVAGEHHEKWDGSGYPHAKAAEEIHIYGRITAVADVFDALGSERVYKKAWPLEDILQLFKNESGKHFDPTLVELFLQNLEKFLAIRDEFRDV
jgi:response regulator RpfG family c-di-GMP phosphodiesterase